MTNPSSMTWRQYQSNTLWRRYRLAGHECRSCSRRRRFRQDATKPRQRSTQLMAMHHHVNHSVLLKILRLLKAFRQFFPDGLFDHPRPGKADECARFGDMNVAQHGVGGGDAPGGWIGEHYDIGLARGTQALHREGGAGHLHERQNTFLHARAPGRRKQDEWRAFLHSRLQPLDDRLAGLHAERAAHEVEILHADDDWKTIELTESELDRVFQSCLGACIPQSVGIAPLVPELQRIEGHLGYPDVDPGLAVEN